MALIQKADKKPNKKAENTEETHFSMKNLHSSDFARAFFYAAAGTDLQPLIRFSHLCDTFVFVSVGTHLDPDTVIKSVEEKVSTLNSVYGTFLEQVDEPEMTHLQDLEHEQPAGWQRLFPEVVLREYAEVFSPFAAEENWGYVFRFTRTLGSIKRPLRLIYLNGEAIATYLALSRNGRYAPKVFCSIQSGQLELQSSPMLPVWAAHQTAPTVWVRGLWQRWGELDCMHRDRVRSVCAPVGNFKHFGQSYEGWSAKLGAQAIPCQTGGESWFPSIVRTFTRTAPTCPQETCLPSQGNNVRLLRKRLTPTIAQCYDAVVAPAKLCRRWGRDMVNSFSIEDPGRKSPNYSRLPAGMNSCLNQLDVLCSANNLTRVAFIPDAFEDEGVVLAEWARTHAASCDVDVFLAEPLDFQDLAAT